MSNTLRDAAVAEFASKVHHAYQKASLLSGTVRRRDTGGLTVQFPKMGKGLATLRQTQVDVTPMNIVHTNAVATMQDWNAPEYTDIFDDAKVNFSEQAELTETITGAIGRRKDQIIIDAAEAGSTTLLVSNDVGGTDSGINTAKLRRAKRLLDEQAVPQMGRTFLFTSQGNEDLLGDSDANTVDKNIIKALVNGEIFHWVGFDLIMIETRTEGGLTKAANDVTNIAYHKSAIGLGENVNFRIEVNYIPEKTSWLANGLFAAGAVAIDILGIVEITSREV